MNVSFEQKGLRAMAQPCHTCCSLSRFAIGDGASYELPVSALMASFALCVTVVLLLVKLVMDSRKIATTAARGEAGVVLERTFFRYLVTAAALIVLEAFSLFLPGQVSWSMVLGRVLYSLRQGLMAAPVFMLWGQKLLWLRALLGGCAVAAIFLMLLFLTQGQSEERVSLLGRCLVCEHFMPLYYALFAASAAVLVMVGVVFVLAGSRVGPRRAVRPWLVFVFAGNAVTVIALGLGLYGPTDASADAGICVAMAEVLVFSVGFALASYRSFTIDTQLLWKVERAGEKAHLMSSFWREETMLDIASNLTIHIIEEGELQVGPQSQVLGRGAFSQVVLGQWAGQNVAVKCLYAFKDGDVAAGMHILQKEVDCVGKLRHHNVVALLGVCATRLQLGDAALSLMLVFEYCEGGSLFERIHTPAASLSSSKWCAEMCAAMAYLHERNFIHRDLKSGNVLLTKSDSCKIADFGLSRALETLGTQTLTSVGTPGWTAPEVLRGESYSGTSDVFSFGVIVWELVTRQLPWEGLNAVQIVGQVLQGASLLDQPPACTPLLAALLAQLNADPRQRPRFAELAVMFQEKQLFALE